MPTPSELFFQNRLAMASVLLFRALQVVRKLPRTPEIQGVLIETEEFFRETRKEIEGRIEKPVVVVAPVVPTTIIASVWAQSVSPHPPNKQEPFPSQTSFAQRLKRMYTKDPNRLPAQEQP